MSQGFTKPESAALSAHEADTTNVHGIPDTALLALQSTERILTSRLPPVANVQGTTDKAWFVFVGRLEVATTPKYVEFYVNAAGISITSSEVGLFSTPAPPNKSGQTLTKIVADGNVDSQTTIGVKRNTSAFTTSIPAGTYLWAGYHFIATGAAPVLATLGRDYGQGRILETETAGALTAAGPWAGAICAVPTSSLTGVCPELRVVLD